MICSYNELIGLTLHICINYCKRGTREAHLCTCFPKFKMHTYHVTVPDAWATEDALTILNTTALVIERLPWAPSLFSPPKAVRERDYTFFSFNDGTQTNTESLISGLRTAETASFAVAMRFRLHEGGFTGGLNSNSDIFLYRGRNAVRP